MPQTLAAWAASAWSGTTITGFTSAVSAGVSTAVVYGVVYVGATVAIATGVSKLAQAIGGGPKLPSGQLTSVNPLQLQRSPAPARRVIYGQTRVSGALVYAEVTGDKNEYLHMIVTMAAHRCQSIGDVYFDDEVQLLDGSGNALGSLAGFATVQKMLGTDTQAANASLVAASGGKWTTNHRLQGIAYLYAQLLFDQSKFPGGIPNLSAVVKGRLVYDPRTSSTAWSANPALCIRDYLIDPTIGLGADAATEIDDASFIAAANICDEFVSLAAGGAERRYTLNGCFDLEVEPATVLEKMCGAMAGFVVYVGGKWVCHAGAYETPTVTLDEDDLRGAITLQTRASLRDTCNSVKGTFVAPEENYQQTDFTPVTGRVAAANVEAGKAYVIAIVGSTDWTAIGASSNAVGVLFTATGAGTGSGTANGWLGEDGGIEIWKDLALDFTTSQSMAQRLAKITLERTRQDITVTMPCKLTALRVQAGDNVRVTNARFGWDEKPFFVEGLKFSIFGQADGMALGVDLMLREIASSVFLWSSGEETTYDPAPNTTLPDPFDVPDPADLVLANAALLQVDGTIVPRLLVTWTQVLNQHVLSGGKVHVEFKPHAGEEEDPSDWVEWITLDGAQVSALITAVQIDVHYDVRVAFENNLGVRGEYVEIDDFAVTGSVDAPVAPTGLSATPSFGSVTLTWTANSEPDIKAYRVYQRLASEADDIAGASLVWEGVATAWTDFLVTGGVAERFWITAVNRSGLESLPSSSVTATPANPNGANSAVVYIFKRAASPPSLPSATTTYTFATAALTGLNNGWSQSIPAADGNPLYVSAATATSTAATDTISAGEWAAAVIFAQDGSNGTNGLNSATIFLFKRTSTSTTPALLSASVGYTFATGIATGMNNGWTQSMPTSGGAYRWMTQATALGTTATDTIGSSEWAPASLIAQDGAAGIDGDDGAASAVVYIFKRAASTPALPTATATYTFATSALTGLNNGWSQSVPAADGNPLYVSAATAASSGATDTILAGEWASAVVMAQDGTDGLNSATIFLFQRTSSSTPPSLPSASVTYTFATGIATGMNNGWTQSMPTSGGAYRWMTQATALGTTATDAIGSGEWAPVSLIAQDGTDGTNGATVLGTAGGGGSAASSSYTDISPALHLPVTTDGNAHLVNYTSAYISNASGSSTTCYVALYRDSTQIAQLGNGNGVVLPAGASTPLELSAVDTPGAGSHTFAVKVKSAAGSSVATGGTLSVI